MIHATHDISDELRTLVDAALDETITDADWRKLCDMLRADRELRGYYIARRTLHAGLMWEGRDAETESRHTEVETPAVLATIEPERSHVGWYAATATAAAVLVAAAAVAVYVFVINAEPAEQPARRGATVAVLMGATNTMLAEPHNGDEVAVGGPVQRGGYTMNGGRVEVAFGSGVEAAISGPARFRLDSDMHTTLHQGRLTTLAKPGYTVRTPGMRIVDLGTAFGVKVDDDGATRVECYRGAVRVELLDDDGEVTETIELTGWDALDRGTNGVIARGTSRIAGLRHLPSDDAMDKLVAWYTFEGEARNATGDGLGENTVSNVTFTEGRNGLAAAFAGTLESFIDLPIDATPESMPRMTWGAWIKPTALVGSNREVLSTDQMGFRRALTLDPRDGPGSSINPSDHKVGAFAGNRGVVASTGPIPEADQWRFIAAVYNADTQTVTVYTDDPATGELVATTDETIALTGGRPILRVGNHAKAENEAFAGLIDDVFVFADALTLDQIQLIHAEGANMFAADLATQPPAPPTPPTPPVSPEPSVEIDSQEPDTGGTADRP